MKTPTKNTCLLAAIATVVCSGVLPASAGDPSGKCSIMYSADFVQDANKWTVVSGAFQVENGMYRSRSLGPEKPLSRAITGGQGWKNYRVEARLKLEEWAPPEGADFGLIARYQDPGNYYIFLYKRDTKTIVIERKLKGELLVLAEASIELKSGEWHDFAVTLDGEDLAVAIDGRQMVRIADRNFSEGGAGLLMFWADVRCAEFKVLQLNPHAEVP
jgi:hypothetical protein